MEIDWFQYDKFHTSLAIAQKSSNNWEGGGEGLVQLTDILGSKHAKKWQVLTGIRKPSIPEPFNLLYHTKTFLPYQIFLTIPKLSYHIICTTYTSVQRSGLAYTNNPPLQPTKRFNLLSSRIIYTYTITWYDCPTQPYPTHLRTFHASWIELALRNRWWQTWTIHLGRPSPLQTPFLSRS